MTRIFSPSPVGWGCHGYVSWRTTPSSSPSLGRRGAPAWAHVIIVSPVLHVVAATASTGGHPIKATTAATPPRGEAAHRPTAPIFIHQTEAAVVIRLIIKVRIILLSSTFNGCLERQREFIRKMSNDTWTNSNVKLSESDLDNELQHGLNALHHPVRFAPHEHHAVSGLRTALLKELDGGLGALEERKS